MKYLTLFVARGGSFPPGIFLTALLFLATLLPLTGAAQSCVPIPAGLVGWWPAEDNALDLIGGNNGVLTGDATFTTGEVGSAFSFDGQAWVTLTNLPALQLQNYTIETWIQRNNLSPAADGLIFTYGSGGYGLGITTGGIPFISNIGNDILMSSTSIIDTSFHHLAVTKNGSTVVFYVDGTAFPAGTAYNTSYTFTTSPAIGGRADILNANDFIGTVDEVSVYNRALAATEIQGIFNAGSAGKCQSGPPVIGSQPTNQTVAVGNTTMFSVTAASIQPLSYQWQVNSNPISGANSPTLVLNNVQLTDAGNYTVLISHATTNVVSSNAVLTVLPDVCTPPIAGLVGWWRGENNTLDTVSGKSGVITNNVSYTTGQVGQAFFFAGNGSAVSLPTNAALQLQNFTIEAWIQLSTLSTGGDQNIFGYGSTGYIFGIRNTGTPFLSKVGSDIVTSSYIFTDNAFHHVAVTKNGANVVFYVDGVPYQAPSYFTSYAFSTKPAIGARGDNFSGNFNGIIDEVSVYNRALQASEIQSIYNSVSDGKCFSTTAPSAGTLPASATVAPGSNTTFSVFATGAAPLTYLWEFNGTVLSATTNSTLTLTNVQSINSGNYQVVVTNSFGSSTSSVEILAVLAQPAILIPPTNQIVLPGASAAFFVDATGGGLTYRWFFNATNAVGTNDYSLLITNAQATNVGTYTVVVTNSLGAATSAPVVLTVLLPPIITNQPQNQTNYIGGTASISVSATTSASAALFYQWRFNGANIAGATNSALSVNNLRATNAGNYSVIVTNIYGKITSSNALLTILSPACEPMPPGLVGWWQGEGTTADVISGNLGTVTGGVTYVPGQVGRAFSVNGGGAGITVGNLTNYQLQNFTIDAWAKRTSTTRASLSSGAGLILSYGSGGYGFGLLDGGQAFLTDVDNSAINSSFAFTDTNWHHLAVTKTATNVVFYLDGTPFPAAAYNPTFAFTTPLAVGARGDNFNNSFLGALDEVDLFNRALSASEVQAIYDATSIGKCPVAPTIVAQLTNQSLVVNSSLTFSVNVAGTGPFGVQWFLNGAAISGATNLNFNLANVSFFQAGAYSVNVTNASGTASVSNIIVTVQPPLALVNGSFETGNFNGWVATDIGFPLYPLTVRAAGFNPDFGFFLTAPTDGSFCPTDGFEGNGPGKISVAQDVFVPTGAGALTFDYRMAWDMVDYGGSTLPRTFTVTVQPYGGGSPLQTFPILTASPQTANFDTGTLHGSVNLSAYAGRNLRISFDQNIAESFTGPGFFQLDHVVLVYSVLPPLVISRTNNNIVLSWAASATNYTLQANGNLRITNGWTTVSTNSIVHGPTNTSVTLPLPANPTFYRLKYP